MTVSLMRGQSSADGVRRSGFTRRLRFSDDFSWSCPILKRGNIFYTKWFGGMVREIAVEIAVIGVGLIFFILCRV